MQVIFGKIDWSDWPFEDYVWTQKFMPKNGIRKRQKISNLLKTVNKNVLLISLKS